MKEYILNFSKQGNRSLLPKDKQETLLAEIRVEREITSLLYLRGDTFAIKLFSYLLVFYHLSKDEVSIVMEDVERMQPLDYDSATGETRMLLCNSGKKVFILDTELLQVTELAELKCRYIEDVCISVFYGVMLIVIYFVVKESHHVRILRYTPPSNVRKASISRP